jgi:hypothetical protein
VDRRETYLKLLEIDPELRNHFIGLAGGSEQFALFIAQELGIQVRKKNAAQVLGMSYSGARKRVDKIKGKKAPKSTTESLPNAPKVTRKRPSRKRTE